MGALSHYSECTRASYTQTLLEGEACFNRGEFDDAVTIFSGLLLAEPGQVEAYNNLGVTYWQLEKNGQALACFSKALALAPDSPMVVANLVKFHEFTGQYDDALDVCNAYLEQHPDDVELNSIRLGLEKFSNQVSDENTSLVNDMLDRAYAHSDAGRIDHALMLFDAILAMDTTPDIIHKIHVSIAGLYNELGNIRKRIQHLMVAFRIDSTDKATTLEVGKALLAAEQYETVINVVATYMLFHPDDEAIKQLSHAANRGLEKRRTRLSV